MDGTAAFVFGGLFGGIMGLMIGGSLATDGCRAQAVKAGAAFYSVNPETGETKFQYKTLTPATQESK